MQNWRDGQPSKWGDALRRESVDYDAAILAWKTQRRFAEAQLELADRQIAALERDKSRAVLGGIDYAAIPTL